MATASRYKADNEAPAWESAAVVKDTLASALGTKIQATVMYKRAYLYWYITADGCAVGDAPHEPASFDTRYARVNIAVHVDSSYALEQEKLLVRATYELTAEVRLWHPVLTTYARGTQTEYKFTTYDAGGCVYEALRLSAELSDKLSRGDINV